MLNFLRQIAHICNCLLFFLLALLKWKVRKSTCFCRQRIKTCRAKVPSTWRVVFQGKRANVSEYVTLLYHLCPSTSWLTSFEKLWIFCGSQIRLMEEEFIDWCLASQPFCLPYLFQLLHWRKKDFQREQYNPLNLHYAHNKMALLQRTCAHIVQF